MPLSLSCHIVPQAGYDSGCTSKDGRDERLEPWKSATGKVVRTLQCLKTKFSSAKSGASYGAEGAGTKIRPLAKSMCCLCTLALKTA